MKNSLLKFLFAVTLALPALVSAQPLGRTFQDPTAGAPCAGAGIDPVLNINNGHMWGCLNAGTLSSPNWIWTQLNSNGTTVANTPVVVSSGTQGANSCSSATTVTMTGLAVGMVAIPGYTSSPAALTGWGANGGMVFLAWPSAANTLSYVLCNQTASSITYSAITLEVGAR